MAVFEKNWQKVKSTIRERGMFMFNNDLLSDVSLVVRASSDDSEPKKSKMAIPAHKFVLSICSPVFFAMFCGEMAEKSDTIDLADCEYEGVLEMLRYLYSEEVKLNERNVMQVLYVAKKYILPSLADECIDFLKRNLDQENVFCILSHAQQYDEKSLECHCWEMIDKKTEEVIKSEGFATIERSLLEAIVKRNTLTISEVELFKAVDLWATKECERKGLATDGNVKRRILGEQIVKAIRFPAMEQKEFASVVLDSNILAKKELKNLVKNFNGVISEPVGFQRERRVGTYQSCCRFDRLRPATQLSYSYECDYDCIGFWVDKEVLLHGIRFYGSRDNQYSIDSMEIRDCQNDVALFTLEDGLFSSVALPHKEQKIYVFDVLFNPFVLKKNNRYVVKAMIDGPNSCYGIFGHDTVQSHGVTFHFMNYKMGGQSKYVGTHISSGQFHEFVFQPIC